MSSASTNSGTEVMAMAPIERPRSSGRIAMPRRPDRERQADEDADDEGGDAENGRVLQALREERCHRSSRDDGCPEVASDEIPAPTQIALERRIVELHALPEERPLLGRRLPAERMHRGIDGDDLDRDEDEHRDGDDRRHRHQNPAPQRARNGNRRDAPGGRRTMGGSASAPEPGIVRRGHASPVGCVNFLTRLVGRARTPQAGSR